MTEGQGKVLAFNFERCNGHTGQHATVWVSVWSTLAIFIIKGIRIVMKYINAQ